MRFRFIAPISIIAVFAQSPVANAEAVKLHQCERDSVIRTVELQADNDSGLPCHILYHRAMENKPTTNLWNANNNAQFCANRYDSFIVKLEKKLNWSCEAIEPGDQPLAEAAAPASSNVAPDAPKVSERTQGDAAQLDNTAAEKVTPVTTRELPDATEHPALARSLPSFQPAQNPDSPLTMTLIRQYFPSGQYVLYKGSSHNDTASLCPGDGFFMWNTKSPDKPIFEMGPDHEFQVDLSKATNQSVTFASRGIVSNQCQTAVSTAYCSNEKYIGSTPLHPALASYYGCDGRSGSSRYHRPLVLVRTLLESESSIPDCALSESYHYMTLAPILSSGESQQITEKYEMELVILPRRSNSDSLNLKKGSVCRYGLGD